MLDTGKPVQTKAGYKARIVCTDVNNKRPILALVTIKGEEVPILFNKDGVCSSIARGDYDLVNVPEERWVALLENTYGDTFPDPYIYSSEEMARSGRSCNKLVSVHKLG